MTDTDGPFDTKPWAEAQWARHAAQWAPSGVYGAPAASTTAGDLPLSVSGLSVGLGAGRAWVRGFGFERTGAAVMQAVSANTHASFSRRDRIVLRRNLATHTITPVLLTGTPASSPAAPALTQSDAGSWDLPCFSFLAPPNSGTSITGVVDERGFIDPGAAGLAFQTVSARDANFPTPTRGLRASTAGDGRFWLYNGSRWVKDGGSVELIASNSLASMGGLMGNTGGFATASSISVPAHTAGRLNVQFRGSWVAVANAASSWQLQYPGGSPVAWHRTANNGGDNATPVAVVLDGYLDSDGSAQTLVAGATVDPGGVSITPIAGSFAVWLL